MATKRSRVVGGVLAVVVLAAIVGINATRESRNRVRVQVATVEERDLTAIVQASGEVRPQRYVNVGANVSGRITHLYVEEGDAVRKGQVLARIDSARFEAALAQSEAALAAARADLERSRADVDLATIAFKRQQQMRADGIVSEQAFDQAQAELRMKQAVVESLDKRVLQQQAGVASNRDDFEKTTVVAPMDGVVTSLQKEEGEVVIGAQSFQPTVMLTIGDLSVMEAEILVDETDIHSVRLGQPASVKVDALADVEIAGEVTEIGASAIPRGSSAGMAVSSGGTSSNQAKDFKVVITLADPPQSLRPGLNATAEIVTATREKVLAVPIQAVVVRLLDEDGEVVDPADLEKEGGGAVRERGEEKEGVFVVSEGKALFRPVKTGVVGETDIEVLEGLSQGEEIVSGSYKTLRTLEHEAKIKLEKDEA